MMCTVPSLTGERYQFPYHFSLSDWISFSHRRRFARLSSVVATCQRNSGGESISARPPQFKTQLMRSCVCCRSKCRSTSSFVITSIFWAVMPDAFRHQHRRIACDGPPWRCAPGPLTCTVHATTWPGNSPKSNWHKPGPKSKNVSAGLWSD